MSAQRRMDIIVSLDADSWSETVAAVRRAGMEVDDEQETLGILAGSVDEDRIGDVEAVQGVRAVERSREVRIAPPDAPVQ